MYIFYTYCHVKCVYTDNKLHGVCSKRLLHKFLCTIMFGEYIYIANILRKGVHDMYAVYIYNTYFNKHCTSYVYALP